MSAHDPSNSQQIARVRAGDEEAFAAAVEPLLTGLVAYAHSLCGNAALAEDVVQDSALIAYRNRHRLFPEADFRTWLKAIVRRQALAAGRKHRRLNHVLSEHLEAVFEIEEDDLADEREALRHCRQALPARYQGAIAAFYDRGLSVDRIAEEQERPPGTVKTLLYRARNALRACMEKRLRGRL